LFISLLNLLGYANSHFHPRYTISFISDTPLDVTFLTPYVFRLFKKSCEIFRTSSEINCLSVSFRRSFVIASILLVPLSTAGHGIFAV
jgi:hypothetical protein